MSKKNRYGYVRDEFKKLGWITSKVETWNGGRMSDCYGVADMLVNTPKRLVLIQVCGAGDRKKHFDKLLPMHNTEALSKHRCLYQIAVDKRNNRWIYQISLYILDDNGETAYIDLNTFKDRDTNLDKIKEYEK